jgi:hypothetical protein
MNRSFGHLNFMKENAEWRCPENQIQPWLVFYLWSLTKVITKVIAFLALGAVKTKI